MTQTKTIEHHPLGQGDKIPYISNLVAISNLVQLSHLLPGGITDLSKVQDGVELGPATGAETFKALIGFPQEPSLPPLTRQSRALGVLHSS